MADRLRSEAKALPLSKQVLHESAQVALVDVRCRPADHARGPEELSPTNDLVFPRTGVFLRHVHRADVVGDPSQVLFFRRDEPYRVSHPARCGDDCTSFAFAPSLLVEAVQAHDPHVQDRPTQPFTFMQAPCPARAFLLHQRIRQAARAETRDPLALDEAAIALLAAVLAHAYAGRDAPHVPARHSTRDAHRAQVEQVQVLLAQRFAESLALDALAHAVHSSPFHLARLFRRETGLSLHQYRLRLRLCAALERLVEGEQDLTRLALELGFSSHAHFSDTFRRALGLAPSACRRSLDARRLRELSTNLKVARAAPP